MGKCIEEIALLRQETEPLLWGTWALPWSRDQRAWAGANGLSLTGAWEAEGGYGRRMEGGLEPSFGSFKCQRACVRLPPGVFAQCLLRAGHC